MIYTHKLFENHSFFFFINCTFVVHFLSEWLGNAPQLFYCKFKN